MALAMVVAATAMACSGDAEPSPAETPGATAPATTQAASAVSTWESETHTAGGTETFGTGAAAAVSTATPSVATGSVGAARAVAPLLGEDEGSSLAVIGSRAVAFPSSTGFSSRLYVSSSSGVSPQSAPVPGGLTVSAMGSVTVAADEAYVIIVPEQRYGPSGPEQMTVDDRQDIRDGLAALGVQEEDIEFSVLAGYGPSAISVEVALDELDTKGQQVLDAVEEVMRRPESFGIVYTLSEENCESTVSLARREAIPAAERAADDLAEALGVERGEVLGALEYPLVNLAYGFSVASDLSCGAQPTSLYPSLMPFDSEPEVEVSVGLQITYRIP